MLTADEIAREWHATYGERALAEWVSRHGRARQPGFEQEVEAAIRALIAGREAGGAVG